MARVEHTCTGCVPIDASIIDVYVTLVETNKAVTNAEAGRVTAEGRRVAAEAERASTFTADHGRAVSDHSIAQQDHALAGTDHSASAAATASANAAASLANLKAELVQQRLDTADADHTRAVGDHNTAVSDHSTASSDHTTAQSDHTTAGADHTRAETDHSTAASDHTASGTATAAATAAAALATEKAALVQDKLDRADTDHTRAESDHATAVSDHGIAGTDHTTATGDHTTASADHTLAGADHTTAASDHTTAGSDHTLAASDHTTAAADHTQAQADHAVMSGYDTRLGAVENDVTELEAKVDEFTQGKFYGYVEDADELPEGDIPGFAYVGTDSPFSIYNFDGTNWTDSGLTFDKIPVGNGEDIDYNSQNKLQFANRIYDAQSPNGLGYKILRKTTDFASQVTDTNTVYELRYDFTLSANVTIPANCELRFDGGKLVGNGNTITFNKTLITGSAKFDGCEFAGTILNGEVLISWFTDGMSNNSDYSVDHTAAFVSAMKLTARKYHGWLNLERIPVCIKQTIVITDEFGNVGLRNGRFVFVSTADKQALFDYQQRTAYSGGYAPIVDCSFQDVGNNYDTCVIKKTNWSDTAFTYWRDINANGFTGYFFVTNSYIQEVTFENISVDGCGFFSTNSDSLYAGGYGSGNIINFLNCNCNGGVNNSKTNIRAIYDFSNCIEVNIQNGVCQGRIGGTNIYPVYVSYTGSGSTNRNTIIINGLWTEYVSGNVLNRVKVENTSAYIEISKNSPVGLEVVNSNLTAKLRNSGGVYGSTMLDNIVIDGTSNVTLDIDTAFYSNFISKGKYHIFKDLVDRGIVRIAKNSTPPYGSSVDSSGPSIALFAKNEVNAVREYISAQITSPVVPNNRPFKHYLSEENGVPVLVIEQVGTGQYYEFTFLGGLGTLLGGGTDTLASRSLFSECLYRVTTLVNVDSTNIADVYCSSRGFVNAGGGAYEDMFVPEIGMNAGDNSGWVYSAETNAWTKSGLNSGAYLKMRNCKIEFALLRYARRNVSLEDVLFVDGSGNLQTRKRQPEQFYIPVSQTYDNLVDMAGIVGTFTGVVKTPQNVYQNDNGVLRSMFMKKSGRSIDRPTLRVEDAGFVYFDTDLGACIVWNGSSWVYTDGSTIPWTPVEVKNLSAYAIVAAHTSSEGSQVYSTDWYASPYLDVANISKIRISVIGVAASSYNYGVAFYDSSKAVLPGSGIVYTEQAQDGNYLKEITIPAGCAYVRTCIKREFGVTISLLVWNGA